MAEGNASVSVLLSIEDDGAEDVSLTVDQRAVDIPRSLKRGESTYVNLDLAPGTYEFSVKVGERRAQLKVEATAQQQWVAVTYWGDRQPEPFELYSSPTPIASQ